MTYGSRLSQCYCVPTYYDSRLDDCKSINNTSVTLSVKLILLWCIVIDTPRQVRPRINDGCERQRQLYKSTTTYKNAWDPFFEYFVSSPNNKDEPANMDELWALSAQRKVQTTTASVTAQQLVKKDAHMSTCKSVATTGTSSLFSPRVRRWYLCNTSSSLQWLLPPEEKMNVFSPSTEILNILHGASVV